ncbi:MAG: polyhydroxyalkanoate synthesis repressor PhaR [Rhodocyclales bacterium]|nr:polyhydroxyalkanoate synthesis repressor PhaR [Rhodocyclales bacterium]
MAEQSRLIKKYPNRRLYDTRTSTYITLPDVKELVLAHENFQVVDAKSGEDLTRAILLQIILEEEAGGAPMFSSDLLSQMIRFYGSAMQGMMGRYLDNNMKAFVEMQVKLKDQARTIYGDKSSGNQDLWTQFLSFQGPAMQQMMGSYVDQTQKVFQQMQDRMKEQARKIFPEVAPEVAPDPASETSPERSPEDSVAPINAKRKK